MEEQRRIEAEEKLRRLEESLRKRLLSLEKLREFHRPREPRAVHPLYCEALQGDRWIAVDCP